MISKRILHPALAIVLLGAFGSALTGCSQTIGYAPGRVLPSLGEDEREGPAYFTQVHDMGTRYAHNWAGRPCFTIDLPLTEWVREGSSPDYAQWRRGPEVLKVYLSDNRERDFAVHGMSTEGVLRSFVGSELDFVAPKFAKYRSSPPQVWQGPEGVWAYWQWQGLDGRRAGVGKTKPADQKHYVASLWLDPWVLSFDWATLDIEGEHGLNVERQQVLKSLAFYPECFQSMDVGETWNDIIPADTARQAPGH